jgi:hypothetical protein
VLEGADLRYARLGDVEVVLRLYWPFATGNWDTIPPIYTAFEVEASADTFR